MAVNGLLRVFSGNAASSSEVDSASFTTVANQADRAEILDDFEKTGITWLWATDAQGRIIYLTEKAAENLGRPVSDLISEQFTAFFENDPDNPEEKSDRPLKYQLSKRSKINDVVVRQVSLTKRPGDEHIWWMINAHPKFDNRGDFHGYRGNAKNVTAEYKRKLEDIHDASTLCWSHQQQQKEMQNMRMQFFEVIIERARGGIRTHVVAENEQRAVEIVFDHDVAPSEEHISRPIPRLFVPAKLDALLPFGQPSVLPWRNFVR